MTYTFPPTKFVEENTLLEQIHHLISECHEAVCASTEEEDYHLEVIDAFHSAETALRIIARDKGEAYLLSLIYKVKTKNRERGYYHDGSRWDGPRRATK